VWVGNQNTSFRSNHALYCSVGDHRSIFRGVSCCYHQSSSSGIFIPISRKTQGTICSLLLILHGRAHKRNWGIKCKTLTLRYANGDAFLRPARNASYMIIRNPSGRSLHLRFLPIIFLLDFIFTRFIVIAFLIHISFFLFSLHCRLISATK
jgi:hypothetical protein